jgi:hypothetical protein
MSRISEPVAFFKVRTKARDVAGHESDVVGVRWWSLPGEDVVGLVQIRKRVGGKNDSIGRIPQEGGIDRLVKLPVPVVETATHVQPVQPVQVIVVPGNVAVEASSDVEL